MMQLKKLQIKIQPMNSTPITYYLSKGSTGGTGLTTLTMTKLTTS